MEAENTALIQRRQHAEERNIRSTTTTNFTTQISSLFATELSLTNTLSWTTTRPSTYTAKTRSRSLPVAGQTRHPDPIPHHPPPPHHPREQGERQADRYRSYPLIPLTCHQPHQPKQRCRLWPGQTRSFGLTVQGRQQRFAGRSRPLQAHQPIKPKDPPRPVRPPILTQPPPWTSEMHPRVIRP